MSSVNVKQIRYTVHDTYSTKFPWIPEAPIASSYAYYAQMMHMPPSMPNTRAVFLGQEWEYTPRFDFVINTLRKMHSSSYLKHYVLRYYMVSWHDGSGPMENIVPVVLFYDSENGYNIDAVLSQTAFMALVGLPHDECKICGRHFHLSVWNGREWRTDNYYGMRISEKIHDLMWTMASWWVYGGDGRYQYTLRPSVTRYAQRNREITTNHYDAINLNGTRHDMSKLLTLELRFGEVVSAIALPALIYIVEYLVKGNKRVLEVDPFSDEYFDTAIKLCNNPLCSEVIKSVQWYVDNSEDPVAWTWPDIRNAIGHVLDNYIYSLIEMIENDADNVVEIDYEPYFGVAIAGYMANISRSVRHHVGLRESVVVVKYKSVRMRDVVVNGQEQVIVE